MSINYTAYIFIGAVVPENHFFTEGKETFTCQNHGVQVKKFCGDCGREGYRSVEQIWTPDLQKAATNFDTTPELLWEKMCPDGGMCFSGDRGEFGYWSFGYQNDFTVLGTAVARVAEDDQPTKADARLSMDNIASALAMVRTAFDAYNIKTPVEVICVQDCG